MKDIEFVKIMDMFEFLHGEHLYMMNLMLHLVMKPEQADKTFEEISKPWIEGFDKVRKKW